MPLTDKRFMNMLVISNIIAFIVIFSLIWVLWDANTASTKRELLTTEISSVTSDMISTAKQNLKKETTFREKTVNLVDAIVKEVRSSNFNLQPQTDTSTSSQNTDTEDANIVSDREYIKAYRKLKTDKAKTLSYSKKDVTGVTIKNTGNNDDKDNRYNKIDVSALTNRSGSSRTLAEQVSAIVSEKTKDKNHTAAGSPAWKDYLNTLKDEGKKRENEMRTIRVKEGETLWRIAVRAYGTGFAYKKIFKANPHLTSPHAITAGEILRVPL